jgi:hypothetical protein
VVLGHGGTVILSTVRKRMSGLRSECSPSTADSSPLRPSQRAACLHLCI